MTGVAKLEDHLGFWLRFVSNHVSQAFATKLAEHDITVAEWVVVRSLHGKEPTAPSQVAQVLGMTKGAITKLADRLIAKGLVLRRASLDDGRAQTLALTPPGSKLVPKLAALADTNDAQFFGELSVADRRHLERILRQMVQRMNMTAAPTD